MNNVLFSSLILFQIFLVEYKMPRDEKQKSGKGASASQHGLNDDDIDKMVSDATFYFLVADPKMSIIKVFIFYQTRQ